MRIITSTDDLESFIAAVSGEPFVAVDTEFMREKTYYPVLCLIQAAAGEHEAIIDPLADGLDLTPFLNLLANDAVVKVFHAARQDIEIFYRLIDAVPAPLFDTQIAAMACGFGEQVGYEPLMKSLLNAKIDKGSRFTDWSRRPLTDAQLFYALSDVTHLRDAYPLLLSRLEDGGRLAWVEEEMATLSEPTLYFTEPEQAWKRLRLKGVKPKEIGPLMALAQWREEEAQHRDVPRNRILKDDALFELARLRPKTADDLGSARSISKGFERSNAGAQILTAIAEGVSRDTDDLPRPERTAPRKPPADVVALLKVLLKHRCEKFGVAPKLIASSDDIDAIALGERAVLDQFEGWRAEVFGDIARRLLDGELALSLKDGAIDVATISQD